mgnify:CR=1 FL=1
MVQNSSSWSTGMTTAEHSAIWRYPVSSKNWQTENSIFKIKISHNFTILYAIKLIFIPLNFSSDSLSNGTKCVGFLKRNLKSAGLTSCCDHHDHLGIGLAHRKVPFTSWHEADAWVRPRNLITWRHHATIKGDFYEWKPLRMRTLRGNGNTSCSHVERARLDLSNGTKNVWSCAFLRFHFQLFWCLPEAQELYESWVVFELW